MTKLDRRSFLKAAALSALAAGLSRAIPPGLPDLAPAAAPSFAAGGPVPGTFTVVWNRSGIMAIESGCEYVVGERGPETVVLPAGSHVYGHRELTAYLYDDTGIDL